jgi:hypothetical protein
MPKHTDFTNCGPCNNVTWVRAYFGELMCDDCISLAGRLALDKANCVNDETMQWAIRNELNKRESVLDTLTPKY